MISLVTQTATGVDLHSRLAAEGVRHEKATLQRRIDVLVYELHGLTEAEIAVEEGNGASQ